MFLHDNEPGELIKDFSTQFLRNLYVFTNATHTFDRETNIEKILQTLEIHDGNRRVDYRFVDSKDNVCIQLSDVIAGLMGKHFDYINDNPLSDIKARKNNFTKLQQHNLKLIRELIDRSDAESDGFCHAIVPLDSAFKNNTLLFGLEAPSFIP